MSILRCTIKHVKLRYSNPFYWSKWPLLCINKLTFGYKNQQQQINNISLNVASNDILGLLGPNGAGKTTLVGLITGLLSPTSGEILIDGLPARLGRKDIALVPQEYAFYPRFTAFENLRYFAGVLGLQGKALQHAVNQALQLCELTSAANKRAGQFSGGMKRRLNFAIALLQQPRLLILDEPTANVDPQSRTFLLDIIRTLNSQGTTIVYTSHLLSEVELLCRSVAVLDAGKIVLEGKLEDLLVEQHQRLLLKLPNALPEDLISTMEATPKPEQWWEFNLDKAGLKPIELLNKLEQENITPSQIQYGQRHLDEVFLAVTQKNNHTENSAI